MPQTPEERALKAWVARLLRVFGLTKDDYDGLLEFQGGNCWFCPPEKEHKIRLAVEHSHRHGHLRGICCSFHNRYTVGRHEDAELLRKLADYIECSPAEQYFGERRIVPGFGKRKKRRKKVT